MKFINVTQIYENLSQPAYPSNQIIGPVTNCNQVTRIKLAILETSIKYMQEVNYGSAKTTIYTNLTEQYSFNGQAKNELTFSVEETIDQIQKQTHQVEFNIKMDEILK